MIAPPRPLAPDAAASLRARFLREARGIPADEVVPLRADPAVVEKNVAAGVAAVVAYDAHIAEHLPAVDLGELRSLPDLARAVTEAAREAGLEEGGDLPSLFAEAYALQRSLRAAAVALVEAGVLGARDVAKLSRDRGAADVAGDCAALASLFQRRAEEIEGKTAAGEEEIGRAAEVASAIKACFKPKAAARKPGPDGMSAVEARDRLWTLLLIRHERLWAVGAYVYGHAVDAQVPALHAVPAEKAAKARAKAAAAAEA